MFFARLQLTGGPDKHSMSQSERIYRFDSRPDKAGFQFIFDSISSKLT